MTEEMLDVVDEDDRVIKVTSSDDARRRNLRTRASHIIIMDRKGNLLIQKRAAGKKIYPSLWEIGVGETIQTGESYESAAIRGMSEELNLTISMKNIKFLCDYKFEDEITKRIWKIYSCILPSHDVTMQEDEISEIKWISAIEAANAVKTKNFAPWWSGIFEEAMKKIGGKV